MVRQKATGNAGNLNLETIEADEGREIVNHVVDSNANAETKTEENKLSRLTRFMRVKELTTTQERVQEDSTKNSMHRTPQTLNPN